jgi:hypothetical protein
MKTKYVPPGGYGMSNGRVLSKSEVTKAIRKYARKYGFSACIVRVCTVLKRAAMKEYVS